ncbi:MAG: hypothetical protein ACLVGL_04025 [Waltera sp.]
MMTLLQSALTGWTDYTQHGKFAALLLLAILYLGFVLYGSGKEANASGAEKARKRLYLYGALVTFGCICPVTALILLKYQTAFYSYVWIWAAVPQTALIAWAATDFLCNLLKKRKACETDGCADPAGHPVPGGNLVSGLDRGTEQRRYRHLDGNARQQQGTRAVEFWSSFLYTMRKKETHGNTVCGRRRRSWRLPEPTALRSTRYTAEASGMHRWAASPMIPMRPGRKICICG